MKKFLAVLFAAILALSVFACDTGENPTTEPTKATDPVEDTKSEGVMTYEEYIAAAVDDAVVVECYVQDHQGWWEDNGQGVCTVYAADQDGAYFIYNMQCTEEESKKLTEGAKIRVTGYKAEWSGEVEITDATCEFLEGKYVAEPKDVTDIYATEDLIKVQNQKILISGAEVVASKKGEEDVPFTYKGDKPGDDVYFNVKIGEATYAVMIESYLRGQDTEVYKDVEALQIGDKIDIIGFLYWYNGPQPHVVNILKK